MEMIIEHIDLWTTAQIQKSLGKKAGIDNISLHGINRLRELILELAVRGKLVAQDSNDEPANVLLEKIETENKKLIEQGKLKKQKSLPGITEEDKPYKLPQGWKFVRLGEIISISSGDGLTANQMDEDGNIPVFGGNGINGYHSLWNVEKKTLVIGRVGYYCGSIHITPQKAWVTDNAFITSVSENNIELEFLYWLLTGTNLKENENATAQPVISGRKIYPIVVGLPPKNEQHRIVAKVDELMALCDQLEQQQMNHIETHLKLVEVLLQTLTDATSAKELKAAWQHLEPHFDILFTTEESVELLKQTILQLAVMGKLVPQDPMDEPASVLLEKIAAEKQRLIKEGKIKKQKPLPEIAEEEKPFGLPEGWEFERLGNFTLRIGSGSTPSGGKSAYVDSGIIFLRSQNVWNDGLELSDVAYITNKIHENMSNTKVFPNDILLNITGGSLGRCTIFPKEYSEANVSQHVSIIRLVEEAMKEYIHLNILSPYIQGLIWGRQVGMAREGLSKKVLELFEIPVPPLQEQIRIVTKVDELMTLCDQLKERIVASQQLKVKLADAVVERAVY